ncbi:YqcC family protein [Aliidiomarina maris]|uniref:Uncharacterized protein YqcC (DUF446 family) n=1 Tax=Aliidiomarina maris TaxID=531312 RepID=A0A327WX34_9GAMM|nr:YqcC family protein [Aliidiomarina maris]MCL5048955.1 YqcC family protein [Bacillota bacterium]RAJ96535.1 uncharacterized protein YqcC (DUF446 family) [Aliidiomarina maris]
MKYQQIQQLLEQLSDELKSLQLWQSKPPAAAALRSVEPFAVDTLAFHQWLQFVMIPRMQVLIAQRHPLPDKMAVSPMAVQVYRGELKIHRNLIACLREIDTLVTGVDPLQAS